MSIRRAAGSQRFDYPNATFTYVTGRNASGDIAGHYVDSAGVSHGFTLANGQLTSIDYPGASFTALSAIDAAGNIAGRCTINGVNHGFLLATMRPPLRYSVRDLGPVGALPGQPFTVADDRSVAGTVMTDSGLLHAVVCSGGPVMTDSGSAGLNSIAFWHQRQWRDGWTSQNRRHRSHWRRFLRHPGIGTSRNGRYVRGVCCPKRRHEARYGRWAARTRLRRP